jgi:hypothetical protein
MRSVAGLPKLKKLVLYNSRSARPGEIDGKDYHFRKREEIKRWREKENFIVLEVRGDLQAVDLEQASQMLKESDLFYEGNPFVGRKLEDAFESKVDILSIFLAPLARDEILYLRSPDRHVSLIDFVTDVMRRKLLRRTQRQKGILSLPDLENIERRAKSAYDELKEAWHFDHTVGQVIQYLKKRSAKLRKQSMALGKILFEDKPDQWMKALRKRWEDWQSSPKVRANLVLGASARCRSAVASGTRHRPSVQAAGG